jgi:hypothetical protein
VDSRQPNGCSQIHRPDRVRSRDRRLLRSGLEARVSARAPLPHPVRSEEIVGQILEGVINDAGGLVLVGGHIVRVPPRQPIEAILAALPAQLAQRLRPLVEAKPQGNLPQLALRQRLSRAIAQYQAQSRG